MKKCISIVLMIACLGLCACKPKEKDKGRINPAFYSVEECSNFLEEQDYADGNIFYSNMDEISQLLSDYNQLDYESREVFDEWVSDNIDGEMMYTGYYPTVQGKNTRYCVTIRDTTSLHYYLPDVLKSLMVPGTQGLYVEMNIYENFDVSLYGDKYASIEDYLLNSSEGVINIVRGEGQEEMDFDGQDMLEISEKTYIRYSVGRLAYPYDQIEEEFEEFGFDGEPVWCYDVFVLSYDSKTGSVVKIQYILPEDDNEEEVQELRELGIPVITDFIK